MISPINTWIAERTGLHGNLNCETLHHWQQEKLKTQIEYARKNSRFYREKLSKVADIKDLPFTSLSDIANDPLAFLAVPQSEVARITTLSNYSISNFIKRVFFTEGDLERTVEFFAAGMSTMVCKGEHAQILISSETKNSFGSLLKESLSRIGVTSGISGDLKNVSDAIEASRNADCIIGMPAEILYMSRVERNLRPKSVLLAADYIPQSIIDSIKEIWKCSVFSHYGHTEFGFGCAVDCAFHCGLHTRDADLIFEIINPKTGKPAIEGENGEIVITTLSNEAMPLIRYRTGDVSRFVNTPCKCGCELPRLARIEGRIENNISINNKGTISIHQLDELIFANPVVRGFEASLKYEEENITLHLNVDSDECLDISAKLPKELNIEINYCKVDPFSNRGKRRIKII